MDFYGLKDPFNSVKALKEDIVLLSPTEVTGNIPKIASGHTGPRFTKKTKGYKQSRHVGM